MLCLRRESGPGGADLDAPRADGTTPAQAAADGRHAAALEVLARCGAKAAAMQGGGGASSPAGAAGGAEEQGADGSWAEAAREAEQLGPSGSIAANCGTVAQY